MILKKLLVFVICASITSACQASSPVSVTKTTPPIETQPVLPTPTDPPVATPEAVLRNPGDRVGSMTLVADQGYFASSLWDYCEPEVNETGVISRSCALPYYKNIFVGWELWTETAAEYNQQREQWDETVWQLYIDEIPVNLEEFGVTEAAYQVNQIYGIQRWNLVLKRVTPGEHTIRYVMQQPDSKVTDVTWTFTVGSPAIVALWSWISALRRFER